MQLALDPSQSDCIFAAIHYVRVTPPRLLKLTTGGVLHLPMWVKGQTGVHATHACNTPAQLCDRSMTPPCSGNGSGEMHGHASEPGKK
mmetsp:Transcript_11887/g.21152  ORF Transcript_11887/g.21152 Transcript_11887/m.21152 type:complete len:88 (-) Transcript_11887:414-677(-)